MRAPNTRLTALVLLFALLASAPTAALCEVLCLHDGASRRGGDETLQPAHGAHAMAHGHHTDGRAPTTPQPTAHVHQHGGSAPAMPATMVESSVGDGVLTSCDACPNTVANASTIVDRQRQRATGGDIRLMAEAAAAPASAGAPNRAFPVRYRATTSPLLTAHLPLVLRI
ncbi:MAG: hypothetical protein AB7Q29_11555 [Vicinamibacterales bacterium]